MSDSKNNLSSVSIIVPVHNDENCIGDLIESLLNQDYPADMREIVIVDNNSTDRSREIVKGYPVTLLQENDIQSSYAARNRGIRNSKHEILAFIDSDCIASPQWLREGIAMLLSGSADLVGGRVEFALSAKRTSAEMYDSITNFDFANSIKKGSTGAGNLFVKRDVFDKVEMFPDSMKSGGDFTWTSRAVQSGHSLVYAPSAVVTHRARRLKALLKKKFRTGGGAIAFWSDVGVGRWEMTKRILKPMCPPGPGRTRKAISQRGTDDMHKKLLGMWLVAYLCNLSSVCGTIASLFHISKRRMS